MSQRKRVMTEQNYTRRASTSAPTSPNDPNQSLVSKVTTFFSSSLNKWLKRDRDNRHADSPSDDEIVPPMKRARNHIDNYSYTRLHNYRENSTRTTNISNESAGPSGIAGRSSHPYLNDTSMTREIDFRPQLQSTVLKPNYLDSLSKFSQGLNNNNRNESYGDGSSRADILKRSRVDSIRNDDVDRAGGLDVRDGGNDDESINIEDDRGSERSTSSSTRPVRSLFNSYEPLKRRPYSSLSSRQPTFNSTFVRGSIESLPAVLGGNRSISGDVTSESPFYSGPTMFGGSSNVYKRNSNSSLREKINTVNVRPMRKASDAFDTSMSSSARRIFNTLEKFSHRLNSERNDKKLLDVQKDKLNATISTSTPYSRMHNKRFTIKELVVPSTAELLTIKRQNQLRNVTETVRELATKADQQTTDTYKPPNTNETTDKYVGKIRSKIVKVREKPQTNDKPLDNEFKLPDVPLLGVTTLPKFQLTKSQDVDKSTSVNAGTNLIEPPAQENQFKFSKAISLAHCTYDANARQPNAYVFSKAQQHTRNETMWTCAKCQTTNSQLINECACCQSSRTNDLLVTFKQTNKNKWQCVECFIYNNNEQQTCAACGAANAKKPVKNDMLDAFKKTTTNKWTCDVCCVFNDEHARACVACGTENGKQTPVVTLHSTFVVKKTDEWECDSCMVRNSAKRTVCACCDAPKPGTIKQLPKQYFNDNAGIELPPTTFTFGVTTDATTTTQSTNLWAPATSQAFTFGVTDAVDGSTQKMNNNFSPCGTTDTSSTNTLVRMSSRTDVTKSMSLTPTSSSVLFNSTSSTGVSSTFTFGKTASASGVSLGVIPSTGASLACFTSSASVLSGSGSSNVASISGGSSVASVLGCSSVASISGSSSAPSISSNLNVPSVSGNSSGPNISSNLNVPNILGNSSVASASGNSSGPNILTNSSVASASGNSSGPNISNNSTLPNISGNSTVPNISGNSNTPNISNNSTQPSNSSNSTLPSISSNSITPIISNNSPNTATNKNLFTFGTAASSAISLSATPTVPATPITTSNQTKPNLMSTFGVKTPDSQSITETSGGFTFGASKSTATTPAVFTFGQAKSDAKEGNGQTDKLFTFGSSAASTTATPTTTTASFTFGKSSLTSQAVTTTSTGFASNLFAFPAKTTAVTAPTFGGSSATTFGSNVTFGVTSTPTTTAAITFGTPATTTTTTATFGASLQTFGNPTTTTTTTSLFASGGMPSFGSFRSSPVTFGSNSTAPPAFGATTNAAVASPNQMFAFGSDNKSEKRADTFAFGAKSPTKSFVASANPPTASNLFTFGKTDGEPKVAGFGSQAFQFGSSTTTAFGSATSAKTDENKFGAGNVFGSATTAPAMNFNAGAVNNASASGGFSFGNNGPVFGAAPTNPASSGFNFGGSPFGGAGATTAKMNNVESGAVSSPSAPFTFGASAAGGFPATPAPTSAFNFNMGQTDMQTPQFDPNSKPVFKFTTGAAPTLFTAQSTSQTPKRVIRKAVRRRN